MGNQRDRPTDEIEINDAMVEAGIQALALTDRRFDTDDDVVIRVYEAMVRCQLEMAG